MRFSSRWGVSFTTDGISPRSCNHRQNAFKARNLVLQVHRIYTPLTQMH
jgi:hypothetical protein